MKNCYYIVFFLLSFLSCYTAVAQNRELSVHTVAYQVVAVHANNQEVVSESNIIETHPSLNIYLPNTFTPNNDGLNDTFGPLGYGIKALNMKVFDRWGNLVFETDSYEKQWDGTIGGKIAQSGTYIYTIEAQGYDGQMFQKNGTVSLIKL